MKDQNKHSRRSFLKHSSCLGASAFLSPAKLLTPHHSSPGALSKDSLVGIQIAPHSLLDEGIDTVLDFLRNEAAMNALMIYSHTYYGVDRKPLRVLAHDHYTPPRDLNKRNLRMSWINHQDDRFSGTKIRHQKVDKSMEYHDRDIFSEIRKSATDRGMKVYIRMLEPGANRSDQILNYDTVTVKDVYGNPGNGPCWNHPEFRQWLYATMEDIFTNYEIDGLQYGAERTGPLSQVWFRGEIPACFCSHCVERNRQKGINPDRARTGYRQMHEFMQQVKSKTWQSSDTVSINLWRFLQQYPEILAWNYEWFLADEEIQQELYTRVKKIKAEAVVGRHVDHQRSSWDPFYRSAISYNQMAEYADFIKPILYHDVFGPRLRYWVIERWQQLAFHDFNEEQTLEYFYEMMGYDEASRVSLERLEAEGMGPEYVYNETKRCVDSVAGKAKVIAGIGIDVLWHGGDQQPFHSDPLRLQKAVYKAIEAGADGLLASREYDEMRFSSLRAFGDAVRQLTP